MFVKAFGARSGCLKGLGIRYPSIYQTIVASAQDSEHIRRLEERIIPLKAANQSKDKQLAEKTQLGDEKTKHLEEQVRSVLDWTRSNGYGRPGNSSSLSGTSWLATTSNYS